MTDPLVATVIQLREACQFGRELVAKREGEGDEGGGALDASIALALRGAFGFLDVVIALMPADPPRVRWGAVPSRE